MNNGNSIGRDRPSNRRKCEESGEADEIRLRHADHYAALADEAEPNLRRDGDPKPWLDHLEEEHDNLRATLDRLEAVGDMQRALQLAAALSRFWHIHGHPSEGLTRLERLLASDDQPTPARGRALNGVAVLAHTTGDRRWGQTLGRVPFLSKPDNIAKLTWSRVKSHLCWHS